MLVGKVTQATEGGNELRYVDNSFILLKNMYLFTLLCLSCGTWDLVP